MKCNRRVCKKKKKLELRDKELKFKNKKNKTINKYKKFNNYALGS